MAHEVETLRLNEDFGVTLDELVELVETYRKRTFDEDILMIKEKFGGIEELASKLRTNSREGIKDDFFGDRDKEFGGINYFLITIIIIIVSIFNFIKIIIRSIEVCKWNI